MFKKNLLSAIIILLPITAFAANNNNQNSSTSQFGSSYSSSSSSSSSSNAQMKDDQKRGTKRGRTADQNSQRENKTKQQKTQLRAKNLIKKQIITLKIPVYGIGQSNRKYKVTEHKRQVPKDIAIKYSQTIAQMLDPEIQERFQEQDANQLSFEGELTPNQLDDIVNLMLQAEKNLNAIPKMALKAKSIDQLLDLIAKFNFMAIPDSFIEQLSPKLWNATIIENITTEQLQAKINNYKSSINEKWKKRIMLSIRTRQLFKNVIHLKGNDGSEVVIPKIAYEVLTPSMHAFAKSPLIKKTNTIKLDLSGPQLEEIGHLATEFIQLHTRIREKNINKRRSRIVDALSDTPLTLAPTTISQYQLINLPSNIPPKLLSALKQVDIQELLNVLPVKMDEDNIDQSFIKILTTLLSFDANPVIVSAVARKWVKHIEQTTKTYDEKIKRLQTNIPILTTNIAKYTTRHTNELFTYSINDLILKNQVPPIQNGRLILTNKKIGSLDGLLNIPNIQTVTHLDLAYNQIKDITGAFDKLTNLTQLGLTHNKITSIAGALDKLTNLTHLGLGINQITDIKGAFDKLTNLTVLDLTHNKITSIAGAFDSLTNLTQLGLMHNKITSIAGAFNSLTNLQRLILAYNPITDIKEAFDKLTNLTLLDLNHSKITSIAGAFDKLTNLTLLSVSSNPIMNIQNTFTHLTHLQTLWIHSINISESQKYDLKKKLPDTTIHFQPPQQN